MDKGSGRNSVIRFAALLLLTELYLNELTNLVLPISKIKLFSAHTSIQEL